VVRSIVGEDDDCPVPRRRGGDGEDFGVADGAQTLVHASGKLLGKDTMPHKFPVKVCSIAVEVLSTFRKSLDEGDVVLSYVERTFPVPRVKLDPRRFLLTGDTGLRSKPGNVGLGECNGTKLYGINQCQRNFTEADLNVTSRVLNHTNPDITGDYQGNDAWFFKDLANDAAGRDVDVIVHVGDYIYRQGPCPIDNSLGQNCSGINVPPFELAADVPREVLMNFVPGFFGDNWYGWWSDVSSVRLSPLTWRLFSLFFVFGRLSKLVFRASCDLCRDMEKFFWPAMKLLQSAPIIPTRGNHEECGRGGYGYFFFLSPFPLCPDEEADCAGIMDNSCVNLNPPYSVVFEHESFLVMDDNTIAPLLGGIDSFTFNQGKCPGPPPPGEFIVPVQMTRVLDSEKARTDVKYYTEAMEYIESLSLERETNFLVSHHPFLAIACNDTEIITADWTLQQALGSNTLDRVSAVISGHQHWFQLLEFDGDALPAQLVVGHGGTKLIKNYVNQDSLSRIRLDVGRPELGMSATVKRGITKSQFGYGIMERNAHMGYDVAFYALDQTTREVGMEDFNMTIPAGPRVVPSDDARGSSHPAAGPEASLPVRPYHGITELRDAADADYYDVASRAAADKAIPREAGGGESPPEARMIPRGRVNPIHRARRRKFGRQRR
jgi:hypothetical protein